MRRLNSVAGLEIGGKSSCRFAIGFGEQIRSPGRRKGQVPAADRIFAARAW